MNVCVHMSIYRYIRDECVQKMLLSNLSTNFNLRSSYLTYLSRSGFDSRRYKISWGVYLASWVQLRSCLEEKVALRWPLDTLYPQKLALTLTTSGGRLVGIVLGPWAEVLCQGIQYSRPGYNRCTANARQWEVLKCEVLWGNEYLLLWLPISLFLHSFSWPYF
jgi:hypothetical protein